MEIIYQHNPLLNKVILNETEKKLLFWKMETDYEEQRRLEDEYNKKYYSNQGKLINPDYLGGPTDEKN